MDYTVDMKHIPRFFGFGFGLVVLPLLGGTAAGRLSAQSKAALPPAAFPFSILTLKPNSDISAAWLNRPIDEARRLSLSPDGHLWAGGERQRLFGLNSTFIPPKDGAEAYAARLAALGVNVLRFHHIDAPWVDGLLGQSQTKGSRSLNEGALDRLDFYIAALKRQGIYANVNLLTGRQFSSLDGLPKSVDRLEEFKARHALGFFDPQALELQREYAKALLGHVNPYTGLRYADDPAVAIVEVNNENGLIMAYLNGWLEPMDDDLLKPLQLGWKGFLAKRFPKPEGLQAVLGKAQPLAEELALPRGQGGAWNLESHGLSQAKLSEARDRMTVTVGRIGAEGWHVQLNLGRLNLKPDQPYTLRFKARANAGRKLSVGIGMAHDPWGGLGFDRELSLGKDWREFSFCFSLARGDANARLNFSGMGLQLGSFEFSDISLRQGGDPLAGLRDGAGLRLPRNSELSALPKAIRALVLEYLYQKEDEYWGAMHSYLTADLRLKSLTMGSIVGCSTPGLMARFDIIDSHAYWNHPVFPNRQWDQSDYYVSNRSLTKEANGGTLSDLAAKRIFGKPFSVSEYDHPYPNQYSAEMWPMLAAFACAQDWDCLYGFSMDGDEGVGTKGETKIQGFFDQTHNPAKAAALPLAARVFRLGLIAPAKEASGPIVDRQGELVALLEARAWALPDATAYGLRRESAMLRRVGLVWRGLGQAQGGVPRLMDAGSSLAEAEAARKAVDSGGSYALDNGQMAWNPSQGWFEARSPEAYLYSGFGQGSGEMPSFAPQGFSALILCPRKGGRLDDPKAGLLAFSCSGSGNASEGLGVYGDKMAAISEGASIQARADFGKAPAWGLGARGRLGLPNRPEGFSARALGADGEILPIPGILSEPTGLKLDQSLPSLWFEIPPQP